MRKWLVEETGEFRPPRNGEYFRSGTRLGITVSDFDHVSDAAIVLITEITDKIVVVADSVDVTPQSNRFDEWNW